MSLSKEKLEEQKQERLGETRRNKESLGGYKMKIVEYNGYMDIIVEFQDKHKAKVHTTYQNFKKESVKNPYHSNVYNIGYIGEGKYKSKINGKLTKAYLYWQTTLERCYEPYELNKHPTYIDCYVCDEWLNFQNFAKWFYKNYYEIEGEIMCLDKDILCKGNKIYSPNTCIFVPQRINTLFVRQQRKRGEYPIGVSPNKRDNCLRVDCNTLDKRKFLGHFSLNKPFQAFTVYKNFKEKYIKEVADEYKDLIPVKLYDAMYRYEVEIND